MSWCGTCGAAGRKSRIRSFQINLEEAIIMCANPKCLENFKTAPVISKGKTNLETKPTRTKKAKKVNELPKNHSNTFDNACTIDIPDLDEILTKTITDLTTVKEGTHDCINLNDGGFADFELDMFDADFKKTLDDFYSVDTSGSNVHSELTETFTQAETICIKSSLADEILFETIEANKNILVTTEASPDLSENCVVPCEKQNQDILNNTITLNDNINRPFNNLIDDHQLTQASSSAMEIERTVQSTCLEPCLQNITLGNLPMFQDFTPDAMLTSESDINTESLVKNSLHILPLNQTASKPTLPPETTGSNSSVFKFQIKKLGENSKDFASVTSTKEKSNYLVNELCSGQQNRGASLLAKPCTQQLNNLFLPSAQLVHNHQLTSKNQDCNKNYPKTVESFSKQSSFVPPNSLSYITASTSLETSSNSNFIILPLYSANTQTTISLCSEKRTVLNYPLWINDNSLCWLDSLLCFISNSQTICNIYKNLGANCCLKKLISVYDYCWQLTNRIEKIECSKNLMVDVRKEVLKYLEPKMKNQKGEQDNPWFALLALLSMDQNLQGAFSFDGFWEGTCSFCGFYKSEKKRKWPLTFPFVPKSFVFPQDVIIETTCLKCNAPNLHMCLKVTSWPKVLAVQFCNGLQHNDIPKYDFSFQGQNFKVTSIIQYSQKAKHFVTWIRDWSNEMWLCCDDLTSSGKAHFKSCPPSFPVQELHAMFWESNPLPYSLFRTIANVSSTLGDNEKSSQHCESTFSWSRFEKTQACKRIMKPATTVCSSSNSDKSNGSDGDINIVNKRSSNGYCPKVRVVRNRSARGKACPLKNSVKKEKIPPKTLAKTKETVKGLLNLTNLFVHGF